MADRTSVRRAGFRRLLAAQSISSFGDWLATFALMALVLDISGSTAAVGGVLALRLGPAALAGPLIARLSTRLGRKPLLMRLDLVRAAAAAAIPLVRALWWVYVLTFVLEICAVVAIAVRDASVRDLVDDDDLPLANGLLMGATYGAIPLGAGAFTLISSVSGALPPAIDLGRVYPAFWLDAATFLGSFFLLSRIAELPVAPDVVAGSGAQPHLRDSWRIPLVRATLPPLVAASVGIGTLFSLGITFVRETLGASEAQFGVLVIVFGFGAAAGLAARQIGGRGGVWAVRLGVQMMGAVLILMAFAGGLGLTLLMALVFGASGAYAIVSGITSLQTDLDPRDRLLALGSFHVIVRMALAAGALAAGLAADLLGSGVFGLGPVRSVMLVSGLVVALSAALVRDVVAD